MIAARHAVRPTGGMPSLLVRLVDVVASPRFQPTDSEASTGRARRGGGRDLAAGGVAAGKKLAAERQAWICFQDEARHTLRPLKARTWAPHGRTPVIPVSGKGSGRISVAGLVCVTPGDRIRLLYRIKVHHSGTGYTSCSCRPTARTSIRPTPCGPTSSATWATSLSPASSTSPPSSTTDSSASSTAPTS